MPKLIILYSSTGLLLNQHTTPMHTDLDGKIILADQAGTMEGWEVFVFIVSWLKKKFQMHFKWNTGVPKLFEMIYLMSST